MTYDELVGDVQPFLALGQRLKADGHRVRIATHATFDKFVRDTGLEFFSIGGNPHELMSYMVKSTLVLPLYPCNCLIRLLPLDPGLIPGMESLRNGDIGKKRRMLAEVCLLFAQIARKHTTQVLPL